MRHPARHLGKAVFGAAVVAALGFGSAQAFAAPADTSAARACDDTFCHDYCVGAGYNGGSCVYIGSGTTKKCLCY